MEMDSTTAIAEIALVSDISGVCSRRDTFWMTWRPTNVASMKTKSIDQNSGEAIWRWTIAQLNRRHGRPVLTFRPRRRLVCHERAASGGACPLPDSRHHRTVDRDPRAGHRSDDDDVFGRLRGFAAPHSLRAVGSAGLLAHDAPDADTGTGAAAMVVCAGGSDTRTRHVVRSARDVLADERDGRRGRSRSDARGSQRSDGRAFARPGRRRSRVSRVLRNTACRAGRGPRVLEG